MKLYVRTESDLEAYGLSMALNQYTPTNSWMGATGVVFDSDSLKVVFYTRNNVVPKADLEVDSYIGVNNIQDILAGRFSFELGGISVVAMINTIKLTSSGGEIHISKDGFRTIYDKVFPSPTPAPEPDSNNYVGKVVHFGYQKIWNDPRSERVVLVKEEHDNGISGLDVLDGFKFKKFLFTKMDSLAVIK